MASAPTARAIIQDQLIQMSGQLAGQATKPFQDYLLDLDRSLSGLSGYSALAVTDSAFGASGNGTRDDTPAFQKAIDQAVSIGGATIVVPSGSYSIGMLTFPAGISPINFVGQGSSSILRRRGALNIGKGWLDISGSNVSIENLVLDGGVTVPTGLFYNADFIGVNNNDPMADSLTRNSSIWVHGPAANFRCRRLQISHTGGYGILLDAGSGGITDVQILESEFSNNRPHLFGFAGPAEFGSWTGGIYVNGDGRTAGDGKVLKRFHVTNCRFLRNAGNCLWSHLYGLEELHEDFHFGWNYFLDCGLDGILVGGVTGGAVGANVFRRVGYVAMTDTDQAVPKWLPNLNATAIDSSGLVKGVPYFNNSMTSINGGCLDLDGHSDSSITGNVCRVPYSDEPEYVEDQIAVSGPTNNGQASYGLNMGNSNDLPSGGRNVQISGNQFINLRAGAVRLFGARDCHMVSNSIIAPDDSVYPPISYGPLSVSVNRRANRNVIRHNRISYSPASGAPSIYEDGQFTPFTAQDVNHVFGNGPIIGNGLATEFSKDVNSGSPVYSSAVWV